jgi:hypothetical protein
VAITVTVMLYYKPSANQPGKSAVVALGTSARGIYVLDILVPGPDGLVACRRRRGFSTSRAAPGRSQSHLAFSTVTHDATKFLYCPSGVASARKV